MRGTSQLENPTRCESTFLRLAAAVALATLAAVLLVLPSTAQMYGPPARTTVGGHFLAPAPSVTSIAGSHLPVPLPSVTSIPNYGYTRWNPYGPYYTGYYRGRGYGYGRAGLSYVTPYYIPLDGYGYGYDYVGGPDLYSGPPIGSYDPILHIVVEQPAARYAPSDSDSAQIPPLQVQPQQEPNIVHEAKPNEPRVLVFRDGHEQEVSNYAIMGQTVYVFDKRTQKVALADLDVPATIKANDERGLEFNVPPQKPAPRNSDLQPKSAPDQSTTAPSNLASIVP
jgi:hypothetical protein